MTDRATAAPAAHAPPAVSAPPASVSLLASITLWKREVVRFLRQPSRIVGALASPIMFWMVIGLGLGSSFSPEGSTQKIGYLEFFFPGSLVMILLLFASIFATISIIEDRREGFLQSVLVSPAPRWTIALGKITGAATLAWLQGMLFLLLAPISGIHLSFAHAIGLAVIIFLVGFGLTGLGFMIAWPMESTQGFHSIMMLFLMPMWMLSGSLFPATGAPRWLQFVMAVNPLTYGVAAVRAMFYPDVAAVTGGSPPGLTFSLVVIVLFGIATFACSIVLASRPIRNAK